MSRATVAPPRTASAHDFGQSVRSLRREDPRLLSVIVEIGGGAASRTTYGSRKWYSHNHGISKSRTSRVFHGDEHGPVTNYLVRCATGEHSHVWPIITESIALAVQKSIKPLSTAQLEARLTEIDDCEHTLEAAENRSSQLTHAGGSPDQLIAAALADICEAEVQIERAAIKRELAARAQKL